MHCSHCYKDAQFKCGSCLESGYCSRDCQKLDWVNHKVECELVEAGTKREREEEEEEEEEKGCHNELDPFTQQNPEEDHFDMYLGKFKYCLDIDSLDVWFLKLVMDPKLNPVDSDDFHLGYPESIRLFVKRYDPTSALWPKSVIPGLNFTEQILLRFADEYDIYLSKYPEKRYQKYVIIFGLSNSDQILHTENVEISNNDIYIKYNEAIEKVLFEVRKKLIPFLWVNNVIVHYRLIEEYDEQNYSVITLKKDLLDKSLNKWNRNDIFVIRINFNLKMNILPRIKLTLMLPNLSTVNISFNNMIIIYFVKKLFDNNSVDLKNLIATNIYENISSNFIGLYKLSIGIDFAVNIETKEFLKVILDPDSDLKNLNAWKFNIGVIMSKLKFYWINLKNIDRSNIAGQKEWELLIRINSQSI